MSPRSSLRNKIIAVLVSLAALWSFAAFVTVKAGVSLVWFAALEQEVAKPTLAVVVAVQAERRHSVEYVAGDPTVSRTTMDAARTTTDRDVARLRTALGGMTEQWATDSHSDARLNDLLADLGSVSATRASIDAATLGTAGITTYYTALVQQGLSVLDTFTVWPDARVIYETSTLLELTHAQETLSQEDALMAGVDASNRFTDADRATFTADVGIQRYQTTRIDNRLPADEDAVFNRFLEGTSMNRLRALEDQVAASPAGSMPLAAGQWPASMSLVVRDIDQLVLTLADSTLKRVQTDGLWVVIRLLLAAGIGLVAVILSIGFSIRTVRSLRSRLAELHVAALDLAEVRLPRIVAELRRGDDVDVEREAPPLEFEDDDIGKVGQAFNLVEQTAIRATVEQAALRRGVRDIFLNLARRSQALVHRQLKLIDAMERRAASDDELEELFRIDHLATRMRRNAENLIVLSGSSAGRAWRAPVPMVDVVRGALGEVEEYTRVKVRSIDTARLSGRAVSDVIHLLAELIENALAFSPPHTPVYVSGQNVANGYAIEIEDRGLGMTPDDLLDANARIEDPPEFQLSSTSLLGFYVVGRLGQRHGIRVHLRKSPYDGITAIVVIPPLLTNQLPELASPDPDGMGAGRGGSDVGLERATVAAAVTAEGMPAGPAAGEPIAMVETIAMPKSGVMDLEAPVVEAPVAETPMTPSGLPWRVRRAKPSVPIQRPTQPGDLPGAMFPNGRAPEDVRRMLSSYQRAALRGRTEGDRSFAPDSGASEPLGTQIPLSVAEIAAHLDVPAGTVQVLLGDLLEQELIRSRDPMPGAEEPTEPVLEAVMHALRSL